jgi:diguanylate cyclase (GGDEF)-like protein
MLPDGYGSWLADYYAMKPAKISGLNGVPAEMAAHSGLLFPDVDLLAEDFLRGDYGRAGESAADRVGPDSSGASGRDAGRRQDSPEQLFLGCEARLRPVRESASGRSGASEAPSRRAGVLPGAGGLADPGPQAAPAQPGAAEATRYRAMVEALNGFIYITSKEYDLEFLNRRLVERLGMEPVGQKCYRALHSLDRVCPWCARDRVFQGEKVDLEVHSPRENCWYALSSSPIHFPDRVSRMTVIQDISARKFMEELTRRLAFLDQLTGLPNRLLFNDRLAMALALARRHRQQVAVMMLDLDRFKDINDNLGHLMGDAVLIGAARRLSGLLRKSDTVARVGGDEFILIFPEITRTKDTVKIARKVLETFGAPFNCQGLEAQVSASLGVALFPDHGQDPETLVRRADLAMYRAKKAAGPSFRFFSPSQDGRGPRLADPPAAPAPTFWLGEEA